MSRAPRSEAARRRRAVFADRDGTIIEERQYLADPDQVRLLPGAVRGLTALAKEGYAVVIVTNQSGIARGHFDLDAYRAVQAEVERSLAAAGVPVLGSYHCPHHPDFSGPCECRKPGTALFRQAAREHDLDLSACVYVGDRLRDVEPARTLGGTGVLVQTGYGRDEARRAPAGVMVAADLGEAAAMIADAARGR